MEWHERSVPGVGLRLGVPYVVGLVGSWLVPGLDVVRLVAIGGACVALGRRWCSLLAVVVGLIVGAVHGGGRSTTTWVLGQAGPMALDGRLVGCWSFDGEVTSGRLRVEWVSTGARRERWRSTLPVYVGGAGPEGCGGSWRIKGFVRRPASYVNEREVTLGGSYVQTKSGRLVKRRSSESPVGRWATWIRSRVDREWSEGRRSPGLALARAMVLGRRDGLEDRLVDGFRRLGLAHLLAVSGVHVGVAGLVGGLVAWPLGSRSRRFGAVAGICLLSALVGPLASLVRAVSMAVVVAIALGLRRPAAGLEALCLAAAGMLTIRPDWIQDLAFQLSVAATAGIVWLGPRLASWLGGSPLARLVAGTVAAQLATLPWAVTVFGMVALASPIANLAAGPWLVVAVATSLGWSVLSILGLPAEVAVHGLDALASVAGTVAEIPWPEWLTPQPRWEELAALAVAVAGGVLWVDPARGRAARWLGVTLATGGMAMGMVANGPIGASRDLAVHLVDVGQGDAVVLQDGRDVIVVDAGGRRRDGLGRRVVGPAIRSVGGSRVAALVASHGDLDHCGGLVELARAGWGREVWLPTGLETTECGRRLVAAVGAGRIRRLQAGDRIVRGRWSLEVLAPRPAPPDSSRAASNQRSLVLVGSAGGRRVLLTGDLGAAGERELVRSWGGRLDVDLLKVGHHGSRSSTSSLLLSRTTPRLGLVSAGLGNPYGHPSAEVMSRLRRRGVAVLRTDRHGMISVQWSDDSPWRITVGARPLPTGRLTR